MTYAIPKCIQTGATAAQICMEREARARSCPVFANVNSQSWLQGQLRKRALILWLSHPSSMLKPSYRWTESRGGNVASTARIASSHQSLCSAPNLQSLPHRSRTHVPWLPLFRKDLSNVPSPTCDHTPPHPQLNAHNGENQRGRTRSRAQTETQRSKVCGLTTEPTQNFPTTKCSLSNLQGVIRLSLVIMGSHHP